MAMPINFTQLFRDSWNFMRNQRGFVMKFMLILLIASAGMSLLASTLQSSVTNPEQMDQTQLAQAMLEQSQQPSRQLFFLFNQGITLFISSWALAVIHSINQQRGINLVTSAAFTARRFVGVALLSILSVFPLFIGLWFAFGNMSNNQSPSILSLMLMIAGIILFIRLCLVSVEYLLQPVSMQSAVKNILILGAKRTGTLFFYCLIVNFFLPLIGIQLSAMAVNTVFSVIVLAAIALVSLFSLIFTYRFYSIFSNQAM
ncbi:hypothetical protein CBG46_00815 [Actinobacillus succinogenes]|uniref:Beta-methylgalactoside transporter inner membrane component n=1 Tax=Actinobacillus succinogenes (strain ATCC 55618 / DSM 22257 / CCUG 43843 / 130Z) TaxID=339671 RepID=A6VMQ6_ACTSZ|nr:hypothetical protein [Actinobacillus succinogenes]ABR74253.1 conserved hypothetical protein [Actinobacillus succinogenes 130Z]PHI39319.1 hypothetical protein CBG46_00815 [Actinobacillus succinogenes]